MTPWAEKAIEQVALAGNRYYVRMHGHPETRYAVCDSSLEWNAQPLEIYDSEVHARDRKRELNARAAFLAATAALRKPSREMQEVMSEAVVACEHSYRDDDVHRVRAMLTRADEEITGGEIS